ncbi:MAG: LacI family DNA-binding transcriptional regulator [Planctomycetes bacterium]|nr:LacI family DNA-binding transcriptional regulator [Planctomycetota bacterium]
MSSVRVIAEEAGVSIATVSRVLNDDPIVKQSTREAVLSVVHRVGYRRPRQSTVSTRVIGFAYTQKRTLAHAFDAAVFDGIVRGCEEARFDVLVLNMAREMQPGESYSQYFRRKNVRGVILRTAEATRVECERIASEGIPHVVISERFESENVNYIDGDSKAECRRAVEYLISLGHRRIAFAMHNVPDRDHVDRFEAYRAALAAAGIPFEERLVYRHPSTLAGGATVMTMLRSLAAAPSAVFFADPVLALGAVKRAAELAVQIPRDLSIIGFDDTDMRFAVHPTLTAVCQDASLLGLEAARWLTRGSFREPLRRTIPTFFEINASVGPGPAACKGGQGASAPD